MSDTDPKHTTFSTHEPSVCKCGEPIHPGSHWFKLNVITDTTEFDQWTPGSSD